jgi:hypothetical protein
MKTITKKTANSIVGKLTAGILATAAVFTSFVSPSAAASVLVVGDSLEVGSAPHLRAAAAGVELEIDAENGRTSTQGVAALAERLRPEHEVIVFPLGTNDLSADAFATSLASVAQLAQGRCVVVATIARRRPPAAELNRVVASLAATGEVQVADWRAAAGAPGVLGRDGTHATDAGYALRASLLAEGVRACLGGGGASGIPGPRDPDVRVSRGERRDEGRPGRAAPPPAEPAPPRARPVRLPARQALAACALALRRVVAPVAAALRNARTAAMRAEPEPVLGAP